MRAGMWAAMLAALSVAACNTADADKGVVATVAGEKITVAELDRELRLAGVQKADDPKVRRAALDEIITRKLLAKAARADNLDKSADALAAKTIAVEAFDAGLARRAAAAKVVEPTPAEAAAFVQAHPEMFARRTGYLIDQLVVPTQQSPALVEALKPTKTLGEVERVLRQRGIAYRRTSQTLDTLRAAPALSVALAKLPSGEPFLLPDPAGFTVNRVRDAKVQPVTGAQAEAVALELLRADRRGKALRERLQTLKTGRVTYGEDYAPPAPQAKAAG